MSNSVISLSPIHRAALIETLFLLVSNLSISLKLRLFFYLVLDLCQVHGTALNLGIVLFNTLLRHCFFSSSPWPVSSVVCVSLVSLPRGGVLRTQKSKSPLLIIQSCEVLPSMPELGQNISAYASPATRNFSLVVTSAFLVHSTAFSLSKTSPYIWTPLAVGQRDKTGHHARRHRRSVKTPASQCPPNVKRPQNTRDRVSSQCSRHGPVVLETLSPKLNPYRADCLGNICVEDPILLSAVAKWNVNIKIVWPCLTCLLFALDCVLSSAVRLVLRWLVIWTGVEESASKEALLLALERRYKNTRR